MTAQPPCIDGDICVRIEGGYLRVPDGRPNQMIEGAPLKDRADGFLYRWHDAGNYVCSGYGVTLRRVIRGVLTRCAACRAAWKEEGTK